MLARSNIFIKYAHIKCMQELRQVSVRVIKNPVTIKDVTEKHIRKEILQVELGISYQRSAKLLRNNKHLHEIKNERLRDTIRTLQQFNIDSEDIYKHPLSLNIMNSTVEHNILFLKEAGFKNVSAATLVKFRTLVKKPLSFLKVHGVISEDINVVDRLCSYLKLDGIKLTDEEYLSVNDSLVRIHEILLKKYLVLKLQGTEKNAERIFKIYDRFKYKSFQLILEMVEYLKNELKFPDEKILQHGYLFSANVNSVKKICKTFPSLGNVDIRVILFRHPKIMMVPKENIQKILQHLYDFGISEEALPKCFEILTLAPDSVLHRLIEFKKVPEFEVLVKNPRVVCLLYSQNKAKVRLEMLHSLNVKCASLHILCAPDPVFEKYTQDGNDRTKGFDIITYLTAELQCSSKVIREGLSINNFWYHVPLIAIENSLKYLLSENIPKKVISCLPVILLYSKNQLEEAFKEIKENLELKGAHVTNRQMINLCLYLIEKKHHFSGNGVWLTKEK